MKIYFVILLFSLLNFHQLIANDNNNILTLEDGYHNKGRLQIGNYSVCYDLVNKRMADIYCKNLGYLSAITYWSSVQIVTKNYHIKCEDNEINSCQIEYEMPTCSNLVVNLFCQNIVLVGSSNANEGRVEVLYKGEQGLLCDDSFTKTGADTICRQLGYLKAVKYIVASDVTAKYGNHSSSYILDELTCSQSTDDINKCSHGKWKSHDCSGQGETVAVECSNDGEHIATDGSVSFKVNKIWYYLQYPSLTVYDAHALCVQARYLTVAAMKNRAAAANERLIFHKFNCTTNNTANYNCLQVTPKKLKFIDFYFEKERVEQVICSNNYNVRKLPNDVTQIKSFGEWSNICYTNIKEPIVRTLCKILGYSHVRTYGKISLSSNYTYTYLQCDEINKCSITFNYTCQESLNLTCSNTSGTVKIVNGFHNRGLIEIHGKPVCRESFTKTTADIICKNLGYIDAIRFWGSRTYIPKVKITCSNSHSKLDQCIFDYKSVCYSRESVYVFCQNIRLVGGNGSEGRVEVIYKNQVGQLCDDVFHIGSAHTICKQLGFRKAISFGSIYGYHNNRFTLDNLNCSQTDDINLCSHNEWFNHDCSSSEVTGVQCLSTNYCLFNTININFGSFISSNILNINPIPSSFVKIIPSGATNWCTGVFIDELWALTSASCFLAETSSCTIYINTSYSIQSTIIFKHPSYNNRTGDHNLALVKVGHNYNITPMCLGYYLWEQFVETIHDKGWNKTMLVGWNESKLYSLKTDLISMSACERLTGFNTSKLENLICGVLNSTSNFYNQSGGLLFGKYKNDFLIGVTNRVVKTTRPFNNMIFTNIYKYKDWIDSIINKY